MDLTLIQNIPVLSIDFIQKLKKSNQFEFSPLVQSLTSIGSEINMGFSCYAAKAFLISREWDKLSELDKFNWAESLLAYQDFENKNFKNYFIDPKVLNYFDKRFTKFKFKKIAKKTLFNIKGLELEPIEKHIFKTINAENKQTLSTLIDLGAEVKTNPDISLNSYKNISDYLNSYNWDYPWDAGAQFSSMCLYSNCLKLNYDEELLSFIESKIDSETGSYFNNTPSEPRQIINGAMKVLSGLDWINEKVHLPNKLIDFCLENKPKFEGCDLVDYIYVLYRCSLESNHRRSEIEKVCYEVLDFLLLLYHKESSGFSYFINKSQTHYYGIKISNGKNEPDLHGTLLSMWCIVMILKIIEKNIFDYKVIKP